MRIAGTELPSGLSKAGLAFVLLCGFVPIGAHAEGSEPPNDVYLEQVVNVLRSHVVSMR